MQFKRPFERQFRRQFERRRRCSFCGIQEAVLEKFMRQFRIQFECERQFEGPSGSSSRGSWGESLRGIPRSSLWDSLRDNTKDSLRERGRLRSIITIIARIIWCNNMENMVNLHKWNSFFRLSNRCTCTHWVWLCFGERTMRFLKAR